MTDNTVITDQGVEVYENSITEYLDKYVADKNIADMSKEPQSKWNAALIYIYKAVFKNDRERLRDPKNKDNYNDKLINDICDIYIAVDEVPHFTFETMGLPDIDMSGDIRFKFTPKTVQQAIIVLRNELMTHGELYQVFLKSMLSSLDDKFWNSRSKSGHELDLGEEDFKEAAALMLNRLIGIEE